MARVAWPEINFRLRMAQFFDTDSVPARGTTGARFYRARKARRPDGSSGATVLSEGVMAARNSEVSTGYVDCIPIQVGDDFALSDIAVATDVLDRFNVTKSVIGKDAALFIDSVMWAAIMGNNTSTDRAIANRVAGAAQTSLYGSNATYNNIPQAPYFERFAGIPNTGVSATDYASHYGLSPAQGKFTRLENLRAITQLHACGIEPPDGKVFPAICDHMRLHDIRQDTTLVSAMTHRDTDQLYKYEKIEIDGAAFIDTTNPWTEGATYGTYNSSGKVSTVLYMGKDAAGMIKLDNDKPGGSPTNIKFNILDKADKADIYNQKVVGTWKAYYGALLKITSESSDVPHCVAVRCQTSFQ